MKTILICLAFFLLPYQHVCTQVIPSERLKLLNEYLDAQKNLSAFFMIGAAGQIEFQRGFGYADRAGKIPFTDQTLFSIGSITKSFTATAILLLMEKGKLNMQDKLSKFLPDVPEDKKDITLHQLLTHSAGFPAAIGDDYEALTTSEYQKRAFAAPLLFLPGTGYEYSNTGYTLLGMIVEKVSGISYGAFLEKNIFQPAGMITAGYTNERADYSKLAHGYFENGDDWGTARDKKWDGDEPYWNLKGNGGILMTAQDLYRWYLALRNHTILKPETLKLQTTAHVKEGEMDSYYGYGYVISADGREVQHNGGNRIFKADFRWFPKEDMFLVSVSNDPTVRLFRHNDVLIDILRSGKAPDMLSWSNVDLKNFPMNDEQNAAQVFLQVVQNLNVRARDQFIDQYFSEAIRKRNDAEHLNALFEHLSQDIGQQVLEKVEQAEHALQLTLPTADGNARLKIQLVFNQGKIDKVGAELEGK